MKVAETVFVQISNPRGTLAIGRGWDENLLNASGVVVDPQNPSLPTPFFGLGDAESLKTVIPANHPCRRDLAKFCREVLAMLGERP